MRVSKRTHRGWKRGGPALLGLVLLTGGAVFSPAVQAVREVQVFDVSVTIPTQDFYVLPITPGFLEREQQMIWDLVPGRLRPLREHFDVKSSAGGINARLGALPTLFNGGRTYIDLSVTFNGQVLSLEDTLVVWCTEFGRMPTFQKGASGRDHNPEGFTAWMAGAGINAMTITKVCRGMPRIC